MFFFGFIIMLLLRSNAIEYKAVEELDLYKYDGLWYQVYGDNFNKLFQGDGKCSTAHYTINERNNCGL